MNSSEATLEVTKEQVTYFAPADLTPFAPDRFPVWIWMDDPSFYGFPVFGEPAVKVAQDAGGKPVDPDSRTFDPDPENQARVQSFLQRYLPTALGPTLSTKTCLYTLPPDRDFIIDGVPGHPRTAVAIGAGHAFKFASVIGKILSELVLDGRTAADISGFRIDRPILARRIRRRRTWYDGGAVPQAEPRTRRRHVVLRRRRFESSVGGRGSFDRRELAAHLAIGLCVHVRAAVDGRRLLVRALS